MECDLHSEYSIDVDADDRAVLRVRSWRWLEARIVGLLANPRTRLYRALMPQDRQQHAWL